MRLFSAKLICLATLLCVDALSAQQVRRALPAQPTAPTPGQVIPRAVPVRSPASAPPPAPATPTPVPIIPNPQVAGASVNDTARFIAGLPVSENSPLVPLTRGPAWLRHAAFFDKAWAKLENRQLAGLHAWEASYLPEATAPLPVAFYMFSGPDFLYANQFFPNASTYVLAGTEPVGPLPDVARFGGPSLDLVLDRLEFALNSALSFSFFITKEMKVDLQRQELQGTLPIFYVFLARSGKTITDITFLSLDSSGNPQISGPNASKKSTPGVRITFVGAPGTAPQTLYYFTTDLSDGGIADKPGFMKFCGQLGLGHSLLKSASYLMFEPGFEKVRSFLLTHSKVVIQDDSGIPITAYDPANWDLRFFGAYTGPIEIFKQHFQPPLQALYAQSHPPPLDFGIGYRWNRGQSTLIVAKRK